MLVLFFALASAASMRGWKRRRRAAAAAGARGSSGSGRGGGGGGAAVEQQCSLDWLDRATVATFTIEAPVRAGREPGGQAEAASRCGG